MKTFKMYVKTVIYNEQGNILLLNKKRINKKPSWDLPGSLFTEEQSFDETIINNVQKEIGYYVYPGKIIGISDYSNKNEKEVNVIMEGSILNGDLLLSKEYETHTWVPLERMTDYPLAPWLKNYFKDNKNPFHDVEIEIEEINTKNQRRRELIQEDVKINNTSENNSKKINESIKSSFGLLKDTIIRTFHPQEAKVKQTQPKPNQIHQENKIEDEKDSFTNKINLNFKREKEEYIEKPTNDENEIIIEHNENNIIIEHNNDDNKIDQKSNDDIIIDQKSNEDIIIEDNIIKDPVPLTKNIPTPNTRNKKIFDMNINRQENMKNSVKKIKKVIKNTKTNVEPKIKIINENDKIPRIRKEKESTEKVSFNSENIKNGWKERLNRINRTDANNVKKEAPRPKGQRK